MRTPLVSLIASSLLALGVAPAHAALGNIGLDFTAGVVSLTSPGDPIALACLGGQLAVNAEVPVEVARIPCADIVRIDVAGGAGDNVVNLAAMLAADFGALTQVDIDGGAGNDTLTGSFLADMLHGGADDDTLDGGDNPPGTTDQVFGDAGSDTLVWNPGKDDDVNEGGDGNDLVVINGGGGAEVFLVSASAGRVRLERTTNNGAPLPFFVDIGSSETLRVNANGGDDSISAGSGLAALIALELNGGAGNDLIVGGDGADLVHGDADDDTLDGGDNPPGTTDQVFGDAGNDTLVWNPGKDDDINEGGDGNDLVVINGGGGAEVFSIAANGPRVLFQRTTNNGAPLPFFVDIGSSETLRVNANGGDDQILAQAGLAALIALELNGGAGNDLIVGGDGADLVHGDADDDTLDGGDNPPGTTDQVFGDAGSDTLVWNPGKDDDINEGGDGNDLVVINGGGGAEVFSIAPNGTRVLFQRTTNNGAPLPFFVDIGSSETLRVNGNGGDDQILAQAGLAALIALELEGGDGNDRLVGGDGADLLRGGAGNDTLQAGENPAGTADRIFGGDGDDLMIWSPGEDDDQNEGEAGSDTVLVNAAGVGESFTVTTVAGRVLLQRLFPSVFSIDSGSIEVLELNTSGGDDTVDTEVLFDVVQRLDGGAAASPLGDRLVLRGFDADPRVSPVLSPHFGAVEHAGFETTQALAGGGSATAALDGAQEVPPVAGNGRGRGSAVLDATETSVRVLLTFESLSGISTLAHIHGPAEVGSNAAPIFDLGGSGGLGANAGTLGPFTFAVTPQQVQQLKAGLWYFNVHSSVAGGGEIRGQILPDLLLRAPLDAGQVVAGSSSTARGYGTATLAGTRDAVTTTLAFSGLVGESAPGVHSASLVRGPAVRFREGNALDAVTLPASGSDRGAFVSAPFAIDAAQAQDFADGLFYFELQSQEFPQGELRGQITPSLFVDTFE